MEREFAAIVEQADDWYVAIAPEVPGANGQGRTREEALVSLSEAIGLILSDRLETGLKDVPLDAEHTTVRVAA